tara:strand:+ start:41980 stop:42372 length:393 start_codon:yes stop_codon:yes gene_type:complete
MITFNFYYVTAYMRKHWKELLIIAMIAGLFVKMRFDYLDLEEANQVAHTHFKTQIKEINKIHTVEMREKEVAIKKYKNSIMELERDFRDKIIANKERSVIRRETLEKQFSQDKEELANEINKAFNIEYTP